MGNEFFIKAQPVWSMDKESEVNLRLQFKTNLRKRDNAVIKIATSGMYQLWVNGSFVCYGPARAGKNHFRMDRIDISDKLQKEANIIIIEVAGYNANSYAIQNQKSFLQAEVVADNEVLLYTGKDFTARINPYYYRKTQRYSFQRPMMEAYHIYDLNDKYMSDISVLGNETLVQVESKNIISRYVHYPKYEKISAEYMGCGNVSFDKSVTPWRDKANWGIGDELVGFKIDELEVFATEDMTGINYLPDTFVDSAILSENRYLAYKFPYETTGFLTLKINCKRKTKVYVLFDETSDSNGLANHLRMGCANVVRYDLCEGVHNLQMFEVYSMHYLQIVVTDGECTVENVGMIEYKHPPIKIPNIKTEKLKKIAIAAAETYRQNAVDIFMDCPSRERAGWLCDSFFTARTEYFVTGESLVEKSFLENYLHQESYEFLPDGMLPMCYPADFYDKNYIPQWSMWLVLQLKEYFERSQDRELVDRFEPKIKKLFAFYSQHENKYGLLEKLGGWNFVEHSKANDLIKDVNYPTNMLYYAALNAAGQLYNNSDYLEKAQSVKKTVLEQSFNGEFFTDNAVWDNNELKCTGEITEVCQYYAFFFGITDENTHKKLLDTLISDFGPKRKNPRKWERIYPAAPFIGYFLRLDLLSKHGEFEKLRENIENYYYDMACKTGTLWEHADVRASCNHGFSSYVLCWLDKISN